ncbi:hypothetical protein PC113_g18106 [Phytophthora cactorum]|uniref:Uncharacterized protein n=1 Tax=Phytophthora cactorum TaxID=29920 RepID=A0A8T0YRK0_9STRA|nr:hypothetical protein PC113_g18106 [Phytophthora cactorum]
MIEEIYAQTVLTKRTFSHSQRGRLLIHSNGRVLFMPVKRLRPVRSSSGNRILIPGHDIEFVGTTDLLILRDTVKKDPSTLSELVALDLRANGPVMALLTDLNKYWIFFWVAEKKSNSVLIHRAFIDNPGEGFEVIKTLLEQSSADIDAGIEIPYFDHPVKRLKLKSILSTVIESGESGGIRESIQRYYDIASMLGPDLDMARVVASQVTRAIPAYSYYS